MHSRAARAGQVAATGGRIVAGRIFLVTSTGRKWLTPNRFHTANNDSTSRKIQPGGEVFGLLPDATKLVRTKAARLERLSRAHQNSLKSLSWTADNTGRILDRAAADEPLLIAGISRPLQGRHGSNPPHDSAPHGRAGASLWTAADVLRVVPAAG